MAAALGDLIQIVDNQTYLGEDLLNVYYYRVTSITGLSESGLEIISDWFEDTVLPPLLDIQSDLLTHTLLSVRNLSNNVDYFEGNIDVAGNTDSGDHPPLPSWMTINFKLIRESLATRNGSKRFSGLNETSANGQSYDMNPVNVAAIEAALATDIVLGAITVAEPVIVRRPITPPVGTSYTYSSIGGAAYTKFGTQNTRKP